MNYKLLLTIPVIIVFEIKFFKTKFNRISIKIDYVTRRLSKAFVLSIFENRCSQNINIKI